MKKDKLDISNGIKNLALKSGFTDCGITSAGKLIKDSFRLREWLDAGMQAGMDYMGNHFNERVNPSGLVPGARSVIVVLLNYFPVKQQKVKDNFLMSKYAYGHDYHRIMKSMLRRFLKSINEQIIPIKGRVFVDSAPVLERALARLAGLGWIGKHANLISPKHGSFCFIGELIIDVELSYNTAIPDRCGTCTKCLQACPTGAIVRDRIIDSRKCISYWTIENRGAIDSSFKGKFENRIFGCDICQDVCPWNHKAKPNAVEEFQLTTDLINMSRNSWIELTEDRFNELFKHTAVMRTKYRGFMRNIEFICK